MSNDPIDEILGDGIDPFAPPEDTQLTLPERRAAMDAEAHRIVAERHRAYGRVFGTNPGSATAADLQTVLDDLVHFCRAFESTYTPHARDSARLEGRREVWCRIQEFSKLPIDVLMERYHYQPIRQWEKRHA